MSINTYETKNYTTKNYITSWRSCSIHDIGHDLGLKEKVSDIDRYYCPGDMHDFELKMLNGIESYKDRTTFAIEITKCK